MTYRCAAWRSPAADPDPGLRRGRGHKNNLVIITFRVREESATRCTKRNPAIKLNEVSIWNGPPARARLKFRFYKYHSASRRNSERNLSGRVSLSPRPHELSIGGLIRRRVVRPSIQEFDDLLIRIESRCAKLRHVSKHRRRRRFGISLCRN